MLGYRLSVMPKEDERYEQREQEVKIRCHDNPLLNRPDIALDTIAPRHFEDNWLLDFPDRRLTANHSVLRIRIVDDHGWLTFKGPPEPHAWLKERQEIEAPLAEPRRVLAILRAIGLQCIFRYQKFRTEYRVRLPAGTTVRAMFDETPMGNFMELEGSEEALAELIDHLRIPRQALIRESYPALWAERARVAGEPLGDMIFSERREE